MTTKIITFNTALQTSGNISKETLDHIAGEISHGIENWRANHGLSPEVLEINMNGNEPSVDKIIGTVPVFDMDAVDEGEITFDVPAASCQQYITIINENYSLDDVKKGLENGKLVTTTWHSHGAKDGRSCIRINSTGTDDDTVIAYIQDQTMIYEDSFSNFE